MGIETEIEQEVAGLLKEKARLFICFESVTEQMMTDSPEDIDRMIECVSKRESLKEQIDDLDMKVREAAGRSRVGSVILKASEPMQLFGASARRKRNIRGRPGAVWNYYTHQGYGTADQKEYGINDERSERTH